MIGNVGNEILVLNGHPEMTNFMNVLVLPTIKEARPDATFQPFTHSEDVADYLFSNNRRVLALLSTCGMIEGPAYNRQFSVPPVTEMAIALQWKPVALISRATGENLIELARKCTHSEFIGSVGHFNFAKLTQWARELPRDCTTFNPLEIDLDGAVDKRAQPSTKGLGFFKVK